jgi:four helix bundle protein
MKMATAIYRLTQGFPREEAYGLSSQPRRAAVSIPTNIAEDQRRAGLTEYRHFLWIARGWNSELRTQLEIARSLERGGSRLVQSCEALSREVGKMWFVPLGKLKPKPQSHHPPNLSPATCHLALGP